MQLLLSLIVYFLALLRILPNASSSNLEVLQKRFYDFLDCVHENLRGLTYCRKGFSDTNVTLGSLTVLSTTKSNMDILSAIIKLSKTKQKLVDLVTSTNAQMCTQCANRHR